MKSRAITLLLLFLTFLALPTIVSKVDRDIDVSLAFNLAEEEEENHKCSQEILPELFTNKNENFVFVNYMDLHKILLEFTLKHNNSLREIVLPPPEQKLV